jgi:Tol biopolymer transport system component
VEKRWVGLSVLLLFMWSLSLGVPVVHASGDLEPAEPKRVYPVSPGKDEDIRCACLGVTLLYTDGGSGLYTMREDGTDRKQILSGTVLYAQHGNGRLVFVGWDGNSYDIFTVNEDGTGMVQWTDDAAKESWTIWAPDGSHVLFAQDGSIYKLDLKTKEKTVVFEDDDATTPVYAPDGNKIVFSKDGDLWEMSTGSGPRLLRPLTLTPDHREWQPEFDQWGKNIVFMKDDDIYTMDVLGIHVQRVTHNDGERHVGYPHWAPFGGRIAFTQEVFEPGRDSLPLEIFTVNSDGSGEKRVTQDGREYYVLDWY